MFALWIGALGVRMWTCSRDGVVRGVMRFYSNAGERALLFSRVHTHTHTHMYTEQNRQQAARRLQSPPHRIPLCIRWAQNFTLTRTRRIWTRTRTRWMKRTWKADLRASDTRWQWHASLQTILHHNRTPPPPPPPASYQAPPARARNHINRPEGVVLL